MFPRMRQRIAIVAAVVIAGLIYMRGLDEARAPDGAAGCTLLLAESPIDAIVTFVVLSIPVALIGAAAGLLGSRLAGPFVVGIGLTFAALGGGEITPTLRSSGGPGVYGWLALEAVVWAVIVGAAIVICERIGARVGGRLKGGPLAPEPWRDKVDSVLALRGDVLNIWPAERFDAKLKTAADTRGVIEDILEERAEPIERAREREPWGKTLACAAICGVVGAFALVVLGRSADPWQALWATLVAFMIGAMVGHQVVPALRTGVVMLCPLVVGALWYAWLAVTTPSGGGNDALLAWFFSEGPVGAAVQLPVFFASAGVAGTAIGIGWSHVMLLSQYVAGHGDDDELPEPHVAAE